MRDVKGVSFSIWSAKEIRETSVCQVSSFKRTIENGKFLLEGVRDPRMGPLDRSSLCVTCKERSSKCAGHFGHIELTVPVYHISWVRQVIQWLKCICIKCSGLMIRDLKDNNVQRVRLLGHYSSHVYSKCQNCGEKQSSYIWSKEYQRIVRNGKTYKIEDVYEHLSGLSDFIVEDMNMSHPRNMILEVLPVPPPSVRPPIMMGSAVRGEDDLTYRLLQILRQNDLLRKLMEEERPDHVINESRIALQHSITGYIDHRKLGQKKQQSKREYTSISQRLTAKEGRIRGNLMGKRVDFTARSVITGDDYLGVGDVGVPEAVAEVLTVPIKVTAWNKKTLQDLLRSDNSCIRFVIQPSGSRMDLSFVSRFGIELDVGWIIERKLLDNDIVLFNRQPTLHKMGLMAHTVRVMKGSTFRMNLSCTTPYNADFDGDEMNLHALQTVEAQAEARNIMAVKYQIVSPQSNRPVMGVIQDTLLGTYLLSAAGTRLSRLNFFRCVYTMPGWDGKVESKDEYSGHDLISMTLPIVNWEGAGVKIRCGKLLYGQLNKKVLGTSHGSLIHVIFNDCGPDETVLFINRLQLVVHEFLSIRGFSMSVSDIICSKENNDFVHAECNKAYKDVRSLTNESAINGRLNACRDTVGVMVQKPLDQRNQLYCMVNSGSKGSATNISQILAVVGQQNLEGKRIPDTWTNRTLPHFRVGDKGPKERGFIEHSYVEGLAPWEVFFHAISGREGVIDTAVKTAKSGYIQRKFVKALENAVARSDGTIRNADGSIIQFKYGDDGFDAVFIEKQMIDEEKDWNINMDCIGCEEYLQLIEDQEFLKKINKLKDPVHRDTPYYMLPIPVNRIILNAQTIFNVGGTPIDQDTIFWAVMKLVDETDNLMLKILFRYTLNSYKLYHELHITDTQLDKILFDIRDKKSQINVSSGETVGAIAAQSIGEPATQMTLNTFHHAGNSAMNVTLGIPRLMECINCSSNIQTPMTTFTCDNPNEAVNKLKHICLENIVRSYKVTNTPDKSEIELFYLFPDVDFIELVGPTLVLYLKDWYDVVAVKKIMVSKKLMCGYTEGPNPIFHINGVEDIGMFYENTLRKMTVNGIPGASNVDIIREKDKLSLVTGLTEIDKLWEIGVDLNNIYTNDVLAVTKYLGIEAGRIVLMKEIRKILGFYGLYVNARHILLLVDWMTYVGVMTPLTRHGIKAVDASPLKRATFEEVVDVFNQAACLNEKDELTGISERILIGAAPKIGTNTHIEIVTDEEMVEKNAIPIPVEENQCEWNPFEVSNPWEDDNPWQSVPMVPDIQTEGDWPEINKSQPFGQPQFYTPYRSSSPAYRPTSPAYNPNAPPSPMSPAYSPMSPAYSPANTPSSPTNDPNAPPSPMSPAYSPTSPAYSPTSPAPTSPVFALPPSTQVSTFQSRSLINQTSGVFGKPLKKRKTFF